MMASKSVRSAFLENGAASDAWWAAFFRQVCAYQTSLKHSNFRKRLLAYERRGQLSHVDIIRAVFSPRCERCGTRFGHRLLRPFGLRVCAACLPHCVVSNHALEQDYGVAFFELLEAYARLGGPLLPLDAFQNEVAALRRLLLPYAANNNNAANKAPSEWRFFAFDFTHLPAGAQEGASRCYYHEQDRLRLTDAAAAAMPTSAYTTRIRRNALVFLWRADVERALGCSLQSLVAAQGVRRRAAAMLSARVRRLGELFLKSSCCAKDESGAALARRFAPMLVPVRHWMPGGPLNSASGRPRLTMMFMREGAGRLQRLQAIVGTATRALQHVSTSIENWFPPPLLCLAAAARPPCI